MSSRDWVLGVDVAIGHLAIGAAPVDGGQVEVRSLITACDAREGERLGKLDRQVRIWARQLAGIWPPAVVWVEQPSGRFRNLQLTYATGVIQAALFEALGVPVWTIPSSAWKKRTVGVGNATKPQVAAWVQKLGVDVETQDESDACAIAHAGRAMLVSGKWSAAA